MLVCSKLLNFTKSHTHYGVLFSEPVDPARDNCPDYPKIVTQPMDLGTILNKIYLDIYHDSSQFWRDIGLVFKNCLLFNKEETSDLHQLGLTLRECAIFLYDQWYHLSQQRYQHTKEEMGHLLVSPPPEPSDQPEGGTGEKPVENANEGQSEQNSNRMPVEQDVEKVPVEQNGAEVKPEVNEMKAEVPVVEKMEAEE